MRTDQINFLNAHKYELAASTYNDMVSRRNIHKTRVIHTKDLAWGYIGWGFFCTVLYWIIELFVLILDYCIRQG